MNRELIRSTAFIRAARRYLKNRPQVAKPLQLFTNPQNIKLESGFPDCSGMVFKDVSSRKLDRRRVSVTDFKGASHGPMQFWEQDVVDLDDAD